MIYEVRFSLAPSSGLAQTRTIQVTVDAKLDPVGQRTKALLAASMQMVDEGILSWSLDTITPITN